METINPYYNNVRKVYKYAVRTTTYKIPKRLFLHNKEPTKGHELYKDFRYIGDIEDQDLEVVQLSFDDIINPSDSCLSSDSVGERVRTDSVKRSKDKFLDICYNNRFSLFCTFTFDDSILDATNITSVSLAIQNWCKNKVKTHELAYLIVPEYHKEEKNGFKRIHFHGLLKTERDLELVPARSPKTGRLLKTSKGQQKYNLPSWKYGFTSAVIINDNYEACINYVSKYISKDCKKILGRYYYSGGKLFRYPIETHYELVNYNEVQLHEYSIPHTTQKIKYKTAVLPAPRDSYLVE